MKNLCINLEFKRNGKWVHYGSVYAGESHTVFMYNGKDRLIDLPTLTDSHGVASSHGVDTLPNDASDTTVFTYAVYELTHDIRNIRIFDKEAVEKLFELYFKVFHEVPRDMIMRDVKLSEDMRVIIWRIIPKSESDAELYLTRGQYSSDGDDPDDFQLTEADLIFPGAPGRRQAYAYM